MLIREAGKSDLVPVLELARRLDLYYEGLELDRIWLAEEEWKTVGLAVLKRHSDCLELCSLGVEGPFRGQGTAARLIEEVERSVDGDLFLATIIPGYFRRLGFEAAAGVPRAFIDKRNSSWCEGCDREKCVIMVKKI